MELKWAFNRSSIWARVVLIVPLWNWNDKGGDPEEFKQMVLIVPLWNWNETPRRYHHAWWIVLIVPLWNWNTESRPVTDMGQGSNRTFMELKWRSRLTLQRWVLSSNRTFMELKLRNGVEWFLWLSVLIVPLWNWNVTTVHVNLGVDRF